MTGMNVWKRATLAIVRKPVRSGIIGLLMLMVFTSLVAQVGASTALQKMSDDIGGSLGIGFTVDTGENPVSPKEASRFSRIPGVGKTVYERKTLAQVDGAHPVVPEHGPRLDSGLSTQVSVLGTTDSSLSEEFQSGLYRLEQGHHISGNGRNVLIHRDFARENGLSVGSTFRLSQEGRDSTVRVAGIFSGNVQAQSPMPSDASENLIYSGAQVVSALTGEERVGTIRCLSDNPRDLSAAMAQAKKIAGSEYGVTDDSAQLSGVLQSVETVRDLVRMVLLSVCLADVLVLGMALVFWIRSRIHEIGTLLALGIGKMQIIAQFAIETGLMAVVAALCSLGTGSLLSGYVSSLLLHDSGVAPLESLQVEALPPEQTLLILLLGCAVIAIALAVSCAAVLAKSPKSILSSMREEILIMTICLQLDHVNYSYGAAKIRVLSDVNADFESGKMYAITGPSGAGKSTLLSLLAGLDAPSDGVVRFEGEDIATTGYSKHRREHVSLVFQDHNLIDYLTPEENLRLVNPKADMKILEDLGLSREESKRNIMHLSGGQRQRVAVGRALVAPGRAILADEPTGSLDPEMTDEVIDLLRHAAHQLGKCVIVVTHSKRVADSADAVYTLRHKKLAKA